jgi:uncharacterized membrane protein
MATAFKAVLLEGVEVAFIVVAVLAGGPGLLPAVAAVVHRPLARVPENTLKFAVGVLISAFGVFWTGEGLGMEWPGHDLALLALVGALLASGLLGVRLATSAAGHGAEAR